MAERSDFVSPSYLISLTGLTVLRQTILNQAIRMEVKKLNKKILGAFITLLAVAALVTPLFGTAQACMHGRKSKTVVPYENSISMAVVPGTTEEKWSEDGHVVIRKGTQRIGAYDGPLGVGTMYSEAIISVTKFEIPPSGTPPSSVGKGGAIYREKYEIESGPYGAGTLEGRCIMKWDINTVDTPKYYDYVSYSTFGQGTGGLAGITLKYKTTGSVLPAGAGLPPPPGLQVGIMILS
jgi:hypothetical protein